MISDQEPPKFEMEESLDLATAGLTGISLGTAHNIPALLMLNIISGRKLTQITGGKSLVQEKLGEKECYRLEGLYGDEKMTLWIEKHSFLILRIVEQVTLDGKSHTQTTTYDPTMNEEIPDRLTDKLVEGEWDRLKARTQQAVEPEQK